MLEPRRSHRGVACAILTVAIAAFYAGRRTERRFVSLSSGKNPTTYSAPGPALPVRSHDSVAASDLSDKAGHWQAEWSALSRGPSTPAGEQEMARALEKIAEADPRQAVAVAARETNLRLRAVLLRAALTGWGKNDPAAATAWVDSQNSIDRSDAFGALLQGAIADPERAIGLVNSLSRTAPRHSAEYGAKLIRAFSEAGQFERAVTFALSAPEQTRSDWMLPAYSRWAEFQPEAAAASAMRLADPADRASAINAIVVGWAPTEPRGLIEFARRNLAGTQQTAVIARAIGFWAEADVVAAADWLAQNDCGAASDPGIAEIADSPRLVSTPAVAASWAENIANPQLRMQTLASILERWAATDVFGVESYLSASQALAPEERISLRERIRQKQ